MGRLSDAVGETSEVSDGYVSPCPSATKNAAPIAIIEFVDRDPAEIEARRKQYEYDRDKLLTFQELPA